MRQQIRTSCALPHQELTDLLSHSARPLSVGSPQPFGSSQPAVECLLDGQFDLLRLGTGCQGVDYAPFGCCRDDWADATNFFGSRRLFQGMELDAGSSPVASL